jgi:hypothetical protein
MTPNLQKLELTALVILDVDPQIQSFIETRLEVLKMNNVQCEGSAQTRDVITRVQRRQSPQSVVVCYLELLSEITFAYPDV